MLKEDLYDTVKSSNIVRGLRFVRIRLLCSLSIISTSGFANLEPFTSLPKVYSDFNNMLLKLIASKTEKDQKLGRAKKTKQDLAAASPAVCTLPMVPCGSSPVAGLYLRKTKPIE